MSHSTERPRDAQGQALPADHAHDGIAREEPFGIPAITEPDFLRDPFAGPFESDFASASEDWAGGFDLHLGVYARY